MDDSDRGKIILLDFRIMDGNNAGRPADSERFDDIIVLVQQSYSLQVAGGDADVPCTARLCTSILGVVITCVADMPHRHRLRSASTEYLDVPTCRRSTVGGRAFPVAGAKV